MLFSLLLFLFLRGKCKMPTFSFIFRNLDTILPIISYYCFLLFFSYRSCSSERNGVESGSQLKSSTETPV